MSIKKIVLTVSVALILLGVCAMPASAEVGWYTCNVKGTGFGFSQAYIKLEDTGTTDNFGTKWCVASSSQANQSLAIALTAITNGNQVLVYVDPTLTQNERVIYSIYLLYPEEE